MDQDGATRRQALGLGLGALAAAGAVEALSGGHAFAAVGDMAGLAWANNAMRWAQVAFTEEDPPRYDPNFWFDLFKKTHIEAVTLSAGGDIAFYPTKVPLHKRARDLGDRDMLGEMIKGCRALQMSVVCRVDPHAMSEEAYATHPEWAACTADGKPRRHWAAADMWVTCQNGGFYFDFMPAVLKEITQLYGPEGFFGNRWAGSGMCWCATCRTKFRAATGLELPTGNDPQEPRRAAYILWDRQMRSQQFKLWNDTVAAVKKDCFFSPNGGLNDPNTVVHPLVAVDRQGRSGTTPLWMMGKYAKQVRAYMQNLPVYGLFNVGIEDTNRWKDSVQRGPELEAWAHAGIAQGFRPWYCKFNARIFDPRWVAPVTRIFEWHHAHDKYMRNTANLAKVAILNSYQSGTFTAGGVAPEAGDGIRAAARVADAQNGYYQALVEARIPFEMADDRQMEPQHISRYRVLVLPDVAALSDAQCRQLRAFVMAGGRLVATGETSLYDEVGKKRANFGLADLFGCDYVKTESGLKNSYLTPRHPHPLVRGLENAPRIIAATQQLTVRPHDTQRQPLTLVPAYPDLPMERVFPDQEDTSIPMVFCREVGRGRVVYFPMDIDRTFWEVLHEDHLLLLKNAVLWAMDEPQPMTVTGPGLVDISYWRQKNSLAAHLVNMNNPMFMKGPYREMLPAGPYTVSLALPDGAKVGGVKLLESGTVAKTKMVSGRLVVEVPRIRLHEVVAVELA
ncbi:MAG: beta-galactosidase trimerization domain-containing protein [Alphaproteobacteria bacterium]|nr:beta-galactosidase trimerization domain-containing protein [Alphaproteobacteria bacterium]